jgi:SAM-dependent methyltransferase
MDRVERERAAYDEGDVWAESNRWHKRFPHVFSCPNTVRHERLFEELLRSAVTGKRVLELGCGDGENAARLLSFGAEYVYGIDVSDAFLARAQQRSVPGRLEFANRDASQPLGAKFDAIVGRSILHHVDYRPMLRRLYDETLSANGTMVFMEPLGSNPLIRLYSLLAPRAHTADERSFNRDDLEWFRHTFSGFELYPYNFASLPAGIVSSFMSSRPDNFLMRMSDAIDTWLVGRGSWLDSQFRHAILVMRKRS